MKRTLIAVLLSAITLVGGHFYNRRWDRAILLFLAAVAWGIGVYVDLTWRLSFAARDNDPSAVVGTLTSHFSVFGVGVLVLWIAGLILTYVDSRRTVIAPDRWTMSGIAGAVGLSCLTGVVLLAVAVLVPATHHGIRMSTETPESKTVAPRFRSTLLSQYVYLGAFSNSDQDLSQPPSGEGYLRGRFTFDEKAASGVGLELILNGKYKSGPVTTDSNGEFTLRLPPGEWVVNLMIVRGWKDQPSEGSYMVVTGMEPKLTDNKYDEHHWRDADGAKVLVSSQPREPQLSFIIRPHVVISWPEAGKDAKLTTRAEGTLSWQSYHGAASYLVKIAEVKREGQNSTAYYPVTSQRTTSTRFALAELAATPGEQEAKYHVEVMAFAKDGSFLSKSGEFLDHRTFVLTDKQQLIRDEERKYVRGTPTEETWRDLRDNRRRFEAIEILLNDNLIDEADRLLRKVSGTAEPGKKTALTGFALAKRGSCTQANEMFAKATAEGCGCIPDYYHAGCAKQTTTTNQKK